MKSSKPRYVWVAVPYRRKMIAESKATISVKETTKIMRQTIKQHEFDAKPIDALSFEAGKPVALVFGNERRGVSRQFVERADDAFYLPMGGFTQSFNISVACAMALYAAIASGAFAEGTLTEAERDKLLALWLLRDVKAARPILRQAGIELDDF